MLRDRSMLLRQHTHYLRMRLCRKHPAALRHGSAPPFASSPSDVRRRNFGLDRSVATGISAILFSFGHQTYQDIFPVLAGKILVRSLDCTYISTPSGHKCSNEAPSRSLSWHFIPMNLPDLPTKSSKAFCCARNIAIQRALLVIESLWGGAGLG